MARMSGSGSPHPVVVLAGGATLPLLGFGTYQLTGRSCVAAVGAALELGYRHLDTATMYGNEAEVGQALAASGLARDEVFVTTKLWPDDVGHARPTIERSLDALGTDHVDLWLIHWPPGGRADPAAWADLLRARDDGLARAVGVSNHSVAQLDELAESAGEAPAVNQIEWGPSRFDATVLAAHRERSVVLESYSPFRSTARDHPTLVGIAEAHEVSVEQVVIRWHLQHEVVAIPKSSHRERIATNADVFGFELDPDELSAIDAIGG